MYNFRTDLALERREILEKSSEEKLDGIEVEEKEVNEKVKISRVKITNKNGEQAIGKPMRNIYYY
ncbi:MAG: hypothetical protein HFJ51_02420 [Clostridia bacterium]|nr:hypothetical protein [Clostridia bacterium]